MNKMILPFALGAIILTAVLVSGCWEEDDMKHKPAVQICVMEQRLANNEMLMKSTKGTPYEEFLKSSNKLINGSIAYMKSLNPKKKYPCANNAKTKKFVDGCPTWNSPCRKL
jgi:hypothetical protein